VHRPVAGDGQIRGNQRINLGYLKLHPSGLSPALERLLGTTWLIGDSKPIRLRIASGADRKDIIDVINSVAGERKYLQTSRYCPTPTWERLLAEGMHAEDGLLLLAVESQEGMIGFARLNPDTEHVLGRKAGNVGIALLRSYRSLGIGAIILRVLSACALELGYGVLTANILESNLRSRRLFSRFGFRNINCRSIFLVFVHDHVNELYCEMKLSRLREVRQYELSNQQKHDQSEASAGGDCKSFQ
jgi:RimJ/RimL family protein N-acetyltransferase